MRHGRPIALSMLLSMALIVALADEDHLDARRLLQAGQILPLEIILDKVTRDYPGRILEVELEQESEGYVYELEILDASGVIWEVEIDAESGRLLKSERED